jgi:DNA-binding beta-propeller fold protein YncE
VFVADAGSNAVVEFAPEVTGNAVPVARIVGSNTRLNQPQDVALDAAGELWVTNLNNTVTEYASGANGNAAPVARIAGTASHLSRPSGVVIDPDGNVRIADASGPILTFTPAATGKVAPLRLVTRGSGDSALGSPQGLNFDSAGNLVVADAARARVDTLAPGASGPPAPLSVLTASSPPFQHPTGLDLDEAGNVYVADSAANTVSEFASGAHGAATPVAVISGSHTGLATPAFLSELPPPPVPTVHAATAKRLSLLRLLRDGIRLRVSASGRRAFRSQPVTISAAARGRGRLIAIAKATSLRPGRITLTLVPTKAASRVLRRHHRMMITVLVTIRGGFGTEHRGLSLTSVG